MIPISPAMQAILQEPTIESFFLIDIGGLRSTSYSHDLVFDGETYTCDSHTVEVKLPRMTSSVDRQSFTISMLDVNRSTTSGGVSVGTVVSVWISVVHNGEPALAPEDVILIYRGTVDGVSTRIDSASGESIHTLTLSSPMADLDRTRTPFASQDYSNSHHPGDTAYEQIFRDSGPVSLRWGKA